MNNQTNIIEGLVDAIEEALELIEGYVDSKDDENGRPVANNAMRAERLLRDALAKAKAPSKPPTHRFSNRKEVREEVRCICDPKSVYVAKNCDARFHRMDRKAQEKAFLRGGEVK